MDALDGSENRKPRGLKQVYDELRDVLSSLPNDRQKTAKGVLKMGRLVLDLKQAIQDSGLTHYAIAKAADVDIASIDRFMTGERDLRLATAGKIVDALGYELKKISDSPKPTKKAAKKLPKK